MTGRQAVIVIHGIGQQQPMHTLRAFVKAVWSEDKEIHSKWAGTHVWSKPDQVTRNYELRRLSTPQNRGKLETDFFEFYWAHLMYGTGYGHLFGWAKTLLWRRPVTVLPRLRFAFALSWLLVIVVLAGWLIVLATRLSGAEVSLLERIPLWLAAALMTALTLAIPALGYVMRENIGDAARYLHPAPRNIQRRQEIRSSGVELLHELHERGYDRIVVVGHSLGSVIGYDILTYAFPDYKYPAKPEGDDPPPKQQGPRKAHDALRALAQADSTGAELDVDEVQRKQRDYYEELKANRGRWRVTDFVTLGSPLAHAAVLLADDAEHLQVKVDSREYPRCLPALEQKIRTQGSENRHFSYDDEEAHGPIPHHAAVFAPTRWTNLYFPSRWIVKGDLIGGPIAGQLGHCIRNRAVGSSIRRGFLSHRFYWTSSDWPSTVDCPEAVEALREALDLADDRRGGPNAIDGGD